MEAIKSSCETYNRIFLISHVITSLTIKWNAIFKHLFHKWMFCIITINFKVSFLLYIIIFVHSSCDLALYIDIVLFFLYF